MHSSAGEPLMQASFVAAVIDDLQGLHVTLQTSGYSSEEDFRLVASRCDLDRQAHRRWTGADNAPILRNLAALSTLNIPFIIRVPLVPSVTDIRWSAGVIRAWIAAGCPEQGH